MLQREVQGELLVLTDELLRDSPGVTDGSRAYLGSEEWREQADQRSAQARAYSGEGHSEEWRFEFSRSNPH